jgi:adiponectin receptor
MSGSSPSILIRDPSVVAPFPPVRPQPSAHPEKHAAQLARSDPSSRTITFAELPAWAQDNEYVLSGYRRPTGSFKSALASAVTFFHNESVNIHSHLFGAACAFAALVLVVFRLLEGEDTEVRRVGWQAAIRKAVWPYRSDLTPNVDWRDTAGFAIFFASAFACLAGSATYHCCSCHSQKVLRFSGVSIKKGWLNAELGCKGT